MIINRAASTAKLMMTKYVDRLIMASEHGNVEFLVLESDSRGEKVHSDGIRRFTLNFDLPTQLGVREKRCYRLEAHTRDELERILTAKIRLICENVSQARQRLHEN
jgi:hypothetical protein